MNITQLIKTISSKYENDVENLRQQGEYIGSIDDTLVPMSAKDWDKKQIKEYILSTADCGKLPGNLAKIYLEAYRKGYESANK